MIEIAILICATVFNALADRYYPIRVSSLKWTPAQWRWHIFKWLHFYPPLVYIIWKSGMPFVTAGLLALCCLILWRAVYNWRKIL